MKQILSIITAVLGLAPAAATGASAFTIEVGGGKEDLKNVIIVDKLPAALAGDGASIYPSVTTPDGKSLACQVSPASSGKPPMLTVLVPELKAAQRLHLKVDPSGGRKPDKQFSWGMADGLEQLSYDGKPVLRDFHTKFDRSLTVKGKETGNPTTKPYHQLFLDDGKTIITNGPDGMYPHHRGIFYGFNNITYGDKKKADVWHCKNGEHTDQNKVLAAEAGPLFGRQVLQISWHGQDGMVFANERRELTAYHLPGGVMIDFASELTTPLDKVHLDGDPQHAGFHFRATAAIEKKEDEKNTFFIRPDGKGAPGEARNWDPKTKKGPVNLPWDAMSFLFLGKRYTVVYLDNPGNPKEARDSERCYGRIGSYFVYDLTMDKPLKVKYRLWFQEGEPTVEQCWALSKAFTATPNVSNQ